jgi:hypothetical protein
MSRYDVDWDEMEDLAVVAPFFDELRTQFKEGPAPQIGTELATLFVFGAPPVGVVTPAAAPSSRGRTMRRAAAGAVGGLALVAGMGAAGALPAPIQEPVANAAKLVGLNLPHPHHHRHPEPAPADDETRKAGESSTVTTHAHRVTHVPSDSTLTNPDGSTTGTSGATGGQSGTTGKRTTSGSSTSTHNSTVTGSGSAVSSTGGSGSGDHSTNGSNQHQRPTYHGNGRTTRNDTSTTSTTTPPPSDSGSGGGTTATTSPPDTTPTTTAPSS